MMLGKSLKKTILKKSKQLERARMGLIGLIVLICHGQEYGVVYIKEHHRISQNTIRAELVNAFPNTLFLCVYGAGIWL